MRVGYPWRTEGVREQRRRTNAIRDPKNFSGRGRYTPDPGRGPYPWRRFDGPEPQETGGGLESLSGTEPEGWHVCPADSHLEAIRFIHGLGPNDPCFLDIRYKKGRNRQYRFLGENGRQQRLETIYHMMVSAQSPGELGWSCLTLEQFPYWPV